MSKVRIHMAMSLDGYIAGPNQGLELPFGERTEHFMDWYRYTKTFQQQMCGSEGVEGPNDDIAREAMSGFGAWIIGRNMFGGYPGPWGNPGWGEGQWKGWWGPNPPYHCPVFVITHHLREPLVMEGGTTFHFVTDGIKSAMQQARKAAGDADIRIGGGASVASQFIAAGLVDELELHVVPMLLGDGARLFQGLDGSRPALELVRTVASPDVTHLKYRVRNP